MTTLLYIDLSGNSFEGSIPDLSANLNLTVLYTYFSSHLFSPLSLARPQKM